MPVNTTLESASTTASSNGPAGTDQRTIADDALRQYLAFIKSLKTLATLASATTVTPPSTANAFSVTGTTAITTIASTNSWDGRDILFIFAGILTFTHGSNLILPGSANITTAVGDAAWMVQIASGQWRCVGYSRADGSFVVQTQTLTGPLTAARFIPSGSTVPTNGLYLPGANNPAIASNTVLRWDVSSAGVHTFAAPSAGATLAVAGVTGTVGISYVSGGVTQASGYESGGVAYGGTTSNHAYRILSNNVARMQFDTAGGVTINAPTSGTALTVTPVSGANGILATASLSGAITTITALNSSNTASSDARLAASVAGTSAGDPFAIFEINGAVTWSAGADNSDSDTFKLDSTSALTTSTNRFNVTTDGRIYGNALHNNAGAVTGTTNQFLCSGTFTPTLTGVANVAASTSGVCGWIRLGNMVSVWGAISVDPTSSTTLTRIGISLPIASNLAGADLWGVCSVDQGLTTAVNLSGGVSSDTTNDRAELYYVTAADVANRGVSFNFGYIIQ